MAGFLDALFGTPDQTQALGLLGAGLMQGNAGGGIQAALAQLAQAPDKAMDRKYREMQVRNVESEIAQRQAALEKQQRIAESVSSLLGGGSAPAQAQPAQQGQLGSGSFGVMPTRAGQSDMPAMPALGNRLASVPYDSIVALKASGGPDLTAEWKMAREGFERKAGTFYEGVNGVTKYMPDPTKNIDFQNGRVSLLPGASEAQTQITLATKAPEALLNAAGAINLRKNSDGTESPVSSLSENPMLQSILGTPFQGGGRAPQQALMQPQRAPVSSANPSEAAMRTQIAGDTGNSTADYDREIAATSADLKKPLDQASRASLVAHLDDLQRNRQKAVAAPQGVGYGKTTQQEIADAAAKEKALKTAGADVTRETGIKDDAKRYGQMRSGVDRAIELLQAGPTESGAGSMFDSAASFFGQTTKGANLASQLDTLSGWLTANTPRMEGPQSNADVQQYRIMAGTVGDSKRPVEQRLAAAKEVRSLQDKYASMNGYGGKEQAPQQSVQPAQKQMLDSLPASAPKGQKVRDTATGKVLEFNGQSWIEAK
ncbi:MAG: hypothetical protein H7255_14580 [Ramlibacter sp.]|nr:hypothetical protein [Ramlibacter sp.]